MELSALTQLMSSSSLMLSCIDLVTPTTSGHPRQVSVYLASSFHLCFCHEILVLPRATHSLISQTVDDFCWVPIENKHNGHCGEPGDSQVSERALDASEVQWSRHIPRGFWGPLWGSECWHYQPGSRGNGADQSCDLTHFCKGDFQNKTQAKIWAFIS